MNVERIVLAFAGFMVLLTVFLGMNHHSNWFYFTAFVGLNLFQSAFTGFCPLASLLKKMGKKTGSAY